MNRSKKNDFKKEEITTEHFIEHEMAQYGMMGFDEETGHGRRKKGGKDSASTSQGELAGGSDADGESEPQQQQPSSPL